MKKNNDNSNNAIYVTKSYLPPLEEYIQEISTIWNSHQLTNYGLLNNKLLLRLKKYLQIDNLHYVTNGTTALQLALDALNITSGEIITTPFTFIATTNSILWQRCKPVFVDINDVDFNIDVTKIEEKITSNTKAILAVHCFGLPCDVKKIEQIAKNHNLKVIYDAAHSFGTKINNKSILAYGDISCCSFHATKVFHTIEGGLCAVNNKKVNEKLESIKHFGLKDEKYKYVGINAKNSEFHAAMGICVLNHFKEIIKIRKSKSELYRKNLSSKLYIPSLPKNFQYNYIYFPVLFETEKQLVAVLNSLKKKNIYPKRYFYPCTNHALYRKNIDNTPIAENISKRIVCLPLDTYISDLNIIDICNIINEIVK